MMHIFDVQMYSKGFKIFLRYTIRVKIVKWSAFDEFLLSQLFLFTIKRYKKMEFGPLLGEIPCMKGVFTIKVNTLMANVPHLSEISIFSFVPTIKEHKKMPFGS